MIKAEWTNKDALGGGLSMRIKVFNPYWEREWEVTESKGYIEQCMRNILYGNEDFIMLTTKTGGVLSLAPKYLASIEVMDGEDGEKNDINL